MPLPFRVPAGPFERLRRLRRPAVRVSRGYGVWLREEPKFAGNVAGPLISVIVPVYDTPEELLRAAIGSVLAQGYARWEICLADDASPSPHVARCLAEFAARDSRIKVLHRAENGGIAQATNSALAVASGDFVALLDHDDELAPHALARVAAEIAAFPALDIVFSDEDHLYHGRRRRPYFKPGWNPDLMVSQNLVSHLGVYRRALLEKIGGMREGFDGSQDYDLALRAIAASDGPNIRHIPEVLYHWRQHKKSFSKQSLESCQNAAERALQDHLGAAARVEPHPDLPIWTRISYAQPQPAPLVSVVLPRGNALPDHAGYDAFEVIVDLEQAKGEVLVMLAPGLAAARPGWLRELVTNALRPGIGCVGGRIDQPNGRIYFAGYTLHPEKIAQSLRPGSDRRDPGYLGHFYLARNVSAVSGACMAVRTDIFRAAGGFDVRAGAFADVDFCLRVGELGLSCVWTPHARLRHRALPPVASDPEGMRFMLARWGEVLGRDPYANPNLIIHDGNLALRRHPAQTPKRPFS
jgi:GT2 family glycosyltransferase